MVDLGTLGGETSYPEAITNTGQVVGYSDTAGGKHAFSWTAAGGMVDLGTLGGNTSEADAVNEHGEVVGFSELGTDTSYHAFVWTRAEGMVDLGTLGGSESSAGDINDSGRVVGCANSSAFPMGGSYVMSWTRTEGMVNLGAGGCANRVNDSGQIVGFAPIPDDPHGAVRAFVATAAGGLVDLGTLGGRSSDAIDINDQGEVVGDADTTRYSHAAGQLRASVHRAFIASSASLSRLRSWPCRCADRVRQSPWGTDSVCWLRRGGGHPQDVRLLAFRYLMIVSQYVGPGKTPSSGQVGTCAN
jgi:probable HAF family extracellular repeat protein